MSPSKPFLLRLLICEFSKFISSEKVPTAVSGTKAFILQYSYSKWRCVLMMHQLNLTMKPRRALAVWRIAEKCHAQKYLVFTRSSAVFGNDKSNNRWGRISSRHFSCFRTLRSSSFSSSKDNSKEGDTKTPSKTDEEIKVYDPKEDNFFTQDVAFGSKENKGGGEAERPVFIPEEEEKPEEESEDLSAPTNCCQSGCPNCVWIEYAEKLSKKFSDPKLGRERVLKDLEELEDQNIKAFIMMELRVKKII